MRKLLLLLALAIPASAQVAQLTAPDCQFGFTFNVVNSVISSTLPSSPTRLPSSQDAFGVVGYDNRNTNCTSWTLMYQSDPNVSALSIELDEAPSNVDTAGTFVTWPAANVAQGTTLPLTTTVTSAASTFGYFPWISVLANSATGNGRIYGRVLGWKPQAGSDVTSPGNSVVTAGFLYNNTGGGSGPILIKASPGVIHTVTITSPGATSNGFTIWDSNSASCSPGTSIMGVASSQLPATMPVVTMTLDIGVTKGICLNLAGTTPPNLTLSYR